MHVRSVKFVSSVELSHFQKRIVNGTSVANDVQYIISSIWGWVDTEICHVKRSIKLGTLSQKKNYNE